MADEDPQRERREPAEEAYEELPPELTAPPRREPVFNLPGVILFFIVACAGIHLVRVYLLDMQQNVAVIRHFAFIPLLYSGDYRIDFWAFVAPVSYSLLHGGIAHLVINMVWLAAFGSPLAARIGALRFTLFWVVTALASVALYYVLHTQDPTPLVGASGSISGMMGAAARFAFRIDRARGRPAFAGDPLPIARVFRSRTAVTFLVVWFAINLVTGLAGLGSPGMTAQIAWEAHIGGFLAGFLLLPFFDRPLASLPQHEDPLPRDDDVPI